MDLSNNTSFIILASTVFISSITGSLHCVSMCGPMIISMIPENNFYPLLKYHFGRLLIYTILGSISGFIGNTLFNEKLIGAASKFVWLPFCFYIFYVGIQTLKGKPSHFELPNFIRKYFKIPKPNPNQTFVLGIMTGLLPCGWLHTFVIASSATQSALKGALVMFIFWFGSIPALASLHFLFQKLTPGIKKNFPKVTAIILMILGLQIVAEKTLSININHIGHLHGGDAQCN